MMILFGRGKARVPKRYTAQARSDQGETKGLKGKSPPPPPPAYEP